MKICETYVRFEFPHFFMIHKDYITLAKYLCTNKIKMRY